MAAQSPAFALQNGSHSAALFRQAGYSPWLGGGIPTPGELAVAAQSTPNMSVQVAGGRAWIPGSQVSNVTGQTFSTQAAYFGLNDAPVTLTIATADPTNPRIDLVYVAVQDASYSGSNNLLVLGVVTGTPAATPGVPSAPSNSIALAQVRVNANATSITNSVITATPTATLLTVARGGVEPVLSTDVTAGTYVGQYRDHPTAGLQRWNGSAWVVAGGTAPATPTLTANFLEFSGTDFQPLRIWSDGRTAFASGFIKANATLGVTDVQVTTIPTGLAPTSLLRVPGACWVGNTTLTPMRMDAWSASSPNPNWLSISVNTSVASGIAIAVNMHWPLG